jgi:hypothetical protein
MNNRADAFVRFEPETLGLAAVEVTPRSWLPFSDSRSAPVLDPALWQTRAARGLSWHRAGRAPRRRSRQ